MKGKELQILVIQTAFIGDVVLATSLLESIHRGYPRASIDVLIKKGHEGLLEGHPFIRSVLLLDKKKSKLSELSRLLRVIRKTRYDQVINIHRFLSSGILTAFSRAKLKIGFKKNPLSFLFHQAYEHTIDIRNTSHEIDRNFRLLEHLPLAQLSKPALYPSEKDKTTVPKQHPYICMAPASVWYTKQWPVSKWISLIDKLPSAKHIYLLGGPGDKALCEHIIDKTIHKQVVNKAGQLSFLQSVAWMKEASMNYVNDSAPLHFASAVDAPVTAIFCSTVPAFGFGPLSSNSRVAETHHELSCRPCGLHGKKQCPERHFKCAEINLAADK